MPPAKRIQETGQIDDAGRPARRFRASNDGPWRDDLPTQEPGLHGLPAGNRLQGPCERQIRGSPRRPRRSGTGPIAAAPRLVDRARRRDLAGRAVRRACWAAWQRSSRGTEWGDEQPDAAATFAVSHGFTHFTLDLHIVVRADPAGEGWWQRLDWIEEAGLPTSDPEAVDARLSLKGSPCRLIPFSPAKG